MKIGFDYWQVISHYPDFFAELNSMFWFYGHEVHVISAVGPTRRNTVLAEVIRLIPDNTPKVHEVIFNHPSESPELKLAKCKELGIDVFFDDRDDVCRLLNQNGITAMRVTRKDNSTYDLDAEVKP
jgi:acid phosphatase class B